MSRVDIDQLARSFGFQTNRRGAIARTGAVVAGLGLGLGDRTAQGKEIRCQDENGNRLKKKRKCAAPNTICCKMGNCCNGEVAHCCDNSPVCRANAAPGCPG